MRVKALYSVLSKKHKDGEIIFVDDLSIKDPKTKDAKDVISSLGSIKEFGDLVAKKRNKAILLYLPKF